MFIKSEALLKTAFVLMVNHTDKLQLMKNVYDSLQAANENEIEDEYQKKLFKSAKALSDVLMNKGIRTHEQAEMYFNQLSVDEDIKTLINKNSYFTEEVLTDYNYLFSKIKYQQKVKDAYTKLDEAYHDYMVADVSDAKVVTQKLLDVESEFSELMTAIRNSTNEKEVVLISPDDDIEDIGVEQLQEDLATAENKVMSGMWMDHVTGGGFKCGKLYIVASISGGFKSGWMQNMAEHMSIANDPKDFKVPGGTKPILLYINLEMSQVQMTERRAEFYGIDKNYLQTSGKKVEEILKEGMKKHGSKLPVIYQKELQYEYNAQQLETDLKNYEHQGYCCVGIVFDYSDLLDYKQTLTDEANRKAPLVRKNEQLRAIAQKRKIPVITAIQLNRNSSEIPKKLARAATTDVLRDMGSDSIAKAFDVINIPEQLYFCYCFHVNGQSFFSLLVEKDRDGDAKFISMEGKEIPPKFNRVHYVARLNGFKISNDYRDSIREYNLADESIVTTMAFTDEEMTEADKNIK